MDEDEDEDEGDANEGLEVCGCAIVGIGKLGDRTRKNHSYEINSFGSKSPGASSLVRPSISQAESSTRFTLVGHSRFHEDNPKFLLYS